LQATYTFNPPPQPYVAPKVAGRRPPRRGRGAAAAAPRPAPPPRRPRPAPQVQKITLDSKVLFDFDKAVLKPRAGGDRQPGRRQLAQVQKLEVVLVNRPCRRLGSDAYNQKLSMRRAERGA